MKKAIEFKRTTAAALPIRHGSINSAGLDLASIENVRIVPGATVLLRTGWRWEVHPSMGSQLYGRIAPRSSIDTKRLLSVCAGVIDADYEKEILVALHNRGTEDQIIERGEYIAQLIIERMATVSMLSADMVDGAEQSYKRRDGGFGSTD